MVGQEEGVASVQPRIHEYAIAALVCGGAAILNPFIGWILAIVAVIFWVKAKDAIDASKGAWTGKGLALTGVICGFASLIHSVLIFPMMLLIIAIPLFLELPHLQRAGRGQLKDKILSLANEKSPDVYDALDEIDKLPIDKAIMLCLELTDYYLGEHGTEIHLEKATSIGDEIVPFLVEKRNTSLKWDGEYKNLRVKDVTERNTKIESMLDASKKGIVLYAEYPESLELELEKDMKVLRIFLQDCEIKKGTLPTDLNTLREWTWREYGYTLNVLNVWGHPLKYTRQSDHQYILKSGER